MKKTGSLGSALGLLPRWPSFGIRDRIGDWIFPPKGPESGAVQLTQRRVYILPTAAGLMFAATLVLMLIGSINYNLALGYGLAFLLAGTGIVSILHTWRNLAHVRLRAGKSEPTFLGDVARFRILVENPGQVSRVSLWIAFGDRLQTCFDVPAAGSTEVEVALTASRRGLFRPGRFRIYTTYPLGLFHSWANVELELACLVYPRPEAGTVPLPQPVAASGDGSASGTGDEDFSGLRTYHAGDPPKRIAWKATARGQGFFTKQFSGSSGAEIWLDYSDTPESLGMEGRLSRLARWVVDAHQAGYRYGLRLPGAELPLAAGETQRALALETLALFNTASDERQQTARAA
ncbi:MAG: DUF58 domain-containing protein [Burkholderiales bacterium]